MCSTEDGQRNHRRDQHVQIGKLGAAKEQGLCDQNGNDQIGQSLVRMPTEEDMQRHHRNHRGKRRRGARCPTVGTEQIQGQRGQPVEQRRLVKEGQAVKRRRQPVTRTEHLPGDPDVAPLVRQHEWPDARQDGQPEGANKQQESRRTNPQDTLGRGRQKALQHSASLSRAVVSRPLPTSLRSRYSGLCLTSSKIRLM